MCRKCVWMNLREGFSCWKRAAVKHGEADCRWRGLLECWVIYMTWLPLQPRPLWVCVCVCAWACVKERGWGGGMWGTGFSGNVLLNICEIDDTHLKQLERDEGGSPDWRKKRGRIRKRKEEDERGHGAAKQGRILTEGEKRWKVMMVKTHPDTLHVCVCVCLEGADRAGRQHGLTCCKCTWGNNMRVAW